MTTMLNTRPSEASLGLRPHLFIFCLCLGLAACGTDKDTAKKDGAATVDAGDNDGTADTGSADVGSSDTGAANVDSGATSADVSTCGGLPTCLNAKGQEDLGLCPSPAISYTCQTGCCVKKVLCKKTADCSGKLGTPVCPDKRFTCGCDLLSGECVQTVCGVDSDCSAGTLCIGGGCLKAPDASGVTAYLLRPYWLARPGDTGMAATLLGAQGRTKTGQVLPTAKFTWKLSGTGFKLTDGELTATDKAGKATIIASVVGGKASTAATLWNMGPMAAADVLRVVVVDERTAAPIAGKLIVVSLADQVTPDKAVTVELKDGIASVKAVKWPVDLHIIADNYDTVSVLRYKASGKVGDLVIVTRLRHYADLAFDGDGNNLKKQSKLVHGDVLSGKLTYGGQGEAALGISSIGVGSDLLLFNLDAIIGPSVKRPFDPKAPSLVNPNPGEPQDIPGGVTFMLGAPVVPTYIIAAPPGNHVVWSLAGRLGLNELLTQVSSIVSAVSDGLDVGKVVGVLLPYLSGFYSQVFMDVPFGDTNAVAGKLTQKDFAPSIPLGLSTTITPPKLPLVKEGQWADLMLILAGAMLPNGDMVPLGLSAASDTANKSDKADGVVDGDPETPGNQDVELTYAPLHSGLRVGANNHILITAAVNVAGKGKKEGGSIIFSKIGALGAKTAPGPFLPYASASNYNGTTRALTISAVKDAHFYRAVLTGSEAMRWQIFMPKAMANKAVTLPDLTVWGAKSDLAKEPKRAFVGAFELWTPRTFTEIFAPDGLIALVRNVKRTSFIDAR